MLRAVRRGAARSDRSLAGFRVAMKPLVATAPTHEELETKVRDARARIAFYASTPGYAKAFEHLGLGELSAVAQQLSKAKRWEELPPLIDDDVLHRFVTVGTHDEIAERLLERYRDVVTDIEFSIAVRDDDDLARLETIATRLQGDDDRGARATISGSGPVPEGR